MTISITMIAITTSLSITITLTTKITIKITITETIMIIVNKRPTFPVRMNRLLVLARK